MRFPLSHADLRTPPQNVVLPIYLGSGPSSPTSLMLFSFATRVDTQFESIMWFIANESSTFELSSETTPVFPNANFTGTIAHDVVALNGITLPNQEIGTSRREQLPTDG